MDLVNLLLWVYALFLFIWFICWVLVAFAWVFDSGLYFAFPGTWMCRVCGWFGYAYVYVCF